MPPTPHTSFNICEKQTNIKNMCSYLQSQHGIDCNTSQNKEKQSQEFMDKLYCKKLGQCQHQQQKNKVLTSDEQEALGPPYDRRWNDFFDGKNFTTKGLKTQMIEWHFSPCFACIDPIKGNKLKEIEGKLLPMYQLQQNTIRDVHIILGRYFERLSFLPDTLPKCVHSNKILSFSCAFCINNGKNIFLRDVLKIPQICLSNCLLKTV